MNRPSMSSVQLQSVQYSNEELVPSREKPPQQPRPNKKMETISSRRGDENINPTVVAVQVIPEKQPTYSNRQITNQYSAPQISF